MDWFIDLVQQYINYRVAAEASVTEYRAIMGWDDILIMIAIWILSAALAPKPPTPEPAAFKDFEFPQAEEGTPQAVFFGDVWTGGWMVLSYGNYRTEELRS